MSTFLLEIGTEELPADFARLALPQLEEQVRRDLEQLRLPFASLQVTSTPRRLALVVDGLATGQPDREEERKGPPAAQAFQDGAPSPAAVGFARRCGVDPAALEVRDTPKGPFVFALVVERGRDTASLLTELVPAWIEGLQGRRFMRWGEGDCRFSRPIRWLVALLDASVLPVRLTSCDPPLVAQARSRGHRLVAGDVPIHSASSYRQDLAVAGVEVDRASRASTIQSAVAAAASRHQAEPDLPPELFEELVDLVEAPLPLEGTIADRYLDLPAEVSRERDLGDSIMTAIAVAPLAGRTVRFTDLGRLRVQECERVAALRTELTRCGARVTESGDTLTVEPSVLHGAEIETYDDHRMAMCFATLGLKVPGIRLRHPGCVRKTFPNFFRKLAAPAPLGLGVAVTDARTGRVLTHSELDAE